MKTGIFSLPARLNHKEAVDYVKSIGVDTFEPYASGEFETPSVENARKLADYAGEQGVGLVCFSIMADFKRKNIQDEVDKLKKYADIVAAMGGKYLHHTLAPGFELSNTDLPTREIIARAVKGVREVVDYAEQIGVECVYEDQGYYINGVHRFDDFLGEVNRKVGVVADLGNILFVDEKPETFVTRFASMIRHVHVKDYLVKSAEAGYPGNYWYPTLGGNYLRGTIVGHGSINFTRVFSILQKAGYDGVFSMEYCGLEEPYMGQKESLKNMRAYYEMAKLMK